MKLYREDCIKDRFEISVHDKVFAEVEDIELGQVIEVNGGYFRCTSRKTNGSIGIVNPVKIECAEVFLGETEADDILSSDEITCPYCGKEQCDSWEKDDYDSEYNCLNCGSVFRYERHICYDCYPVRRNENVKIV